MNFYIISLVKAWNNSRRTLDLLRLPRVDRAQGAGAHSTTPPTTSSTSLLVAAFGVVELMTEGVIPADVHTFFYLFAPFLAVALALISIVVIPFGRSFPSSA